MGRARYLNPAGFGARVAYSAVATVLLALAIRGSAGRVAGQPGSVLLTPHLAIAVTYRPGAVAIPASYPFPAGT